MCSLLQSSGIRRQRKVVGAYANLASQSVKQHARSWVVLVIHRLRCILRNLRNGLAIVWRRVNDFDLKADRDERRGRIASQQDVDLAGGLLDRRQGLVILICSDGIDRFLSFVDGGL